MFAIDLGWQLYLSLVVALLLLPALIVIALVRFKPSALQGGLWFLALSSLAFLGLCFKLNDNYINVTADVLEAQAGFYSTRLEGLQSPNSSIQMRFCDELDEFRPVDALSAIRLPNYRVGWYQLANKERAFVMLIGEVDRITIIQTKGGTALIGGDLNQRSMPGVNWFSSLWLAKVRVGTCHLS